MTELSFNTGRRSFNINGVVEVSFNDTDASFVEKLYGLFRKLDEQQECYKAGIDKCSGEEVFSRMRELDAGMRKDINELFAKDVCLPLFGDMNVFAIALDISVALFLILCFLIEPIGVFFDVLNITLPYLLLTLIPSIVCAALYFIIGKLRLYTEA